MINPGQADAPPVGIRIYADGQTKDSKMSFFENVVAVTTLLLYTGWIHIVLALVVSSFFSRVALAITIALFSTLLLPAKPVLWPAFNQVSCCAS